MMKATSVDTIAYDAVHSSARSVMDLQLKCKVDARQVLYRSDCWFVVVSGHAVAQLVEAMRYKLEGRGFDPRWCHWNLSFT